MKRFFSFVMCVVMLLGCVPTVAADDDKTAAYQAELWSRYQSMSTYLWDGQTNDAYYSYVDFADNIKQDGWAQLSMQLTDEQLDQDRYTEILANMAVLLECNAHDMIEKQAQADTLKTAQDYVIDAVGTLSEGLTAYAAFGPAASEAARAVAATLDLAWDAEQVLITSLEQCEYYIATVAQYEQQKRFFEAIAECAQDEALKTAAKNMSGIVDKSFFGKVYAASQMGSAATFYSKDVLLDTILLEDMISGDSPLRWTAEELATLSALKKAYDLVNVIDFSNDLGTLLADILYGASDNMNRCAEMMALAEIRKALILKGEQYKAAIDGGEDEEAIHEFGTLMHDVIYVNYRGEYCMSDMIINNNGLLHIFKWNAENPDADAFLNRSQKRTLSYLELLDVMLLDKEQFMNYDGLVTDAYRAEMTVTQYGGELVTFVSAIPHINLSDANTQRINKEIYDEYYESTVDAEEQAREYDTVFYYTDYSWYVNNGVLSLVCWETHPEFSGVTHYKVFNLSATSGETVDTSELLRQTGFTEDTYRQAVKEALGSHMRGNGNFSFANDAMMVKAYNAALKDTLSDENIDAAMPYIGEDGDLYIVGNIYWIAGPESYRSRINVSDYELVPDYDRELPVPAE